MDDLHSFLLNFFNPILFQQHHRANTSLFPEIICINLSARKKIVSLPGRLSACINWETRADYVLVSLHPKMGSVSGENGVLKLVYPGRFVEIHENPITAAEVMQRNPRHCVTRPDVFKFPWIVVRPESVLKPGRVFYVVPYHTIHRLLRSKDLRPRPKVTSRLDAKLDYQVADQSHDHWLQREQDDDSEISIELDRFHQLVNSGNHHRESQNKLNDKCKDTSTDYYSEGAKYLYVGDEKYQNKFYRKQSIELKSQKDRYQSPKKLQVKQWKKETRVYNLFVDENDEVQILSPRHDTETVELRSCLKKHNSIAKSRAFRVRFALDEEDDTGYKKLGFQSTEFQQYESSSRSICMQQQLNL